MAAAAAQGLKPRSLPDPIVNMQYIAEATFELTYDQKLPYDVLDALHVQRSICSVGSF